MSSQKQSAVKSTEVKVPSQVQTMFMIAFVAMWLPSLYYLVRMYQYIGHTLAVETALFRLLYFTLPAVFGALAYPYAQKRYVHMRQRFFLSLLLGTIGVFIFQFLQTFVVFLGSDQNFAPSFNFEFVTILLSMVVYVGLLWYIDRDSAPRRKRGAK